MKRPFSLLALTLAATVAAGCDAESTPTTPATTPSAPAAPVVGGETGKSAPKKPMSEARKTQSSPRVRNDL
jgi:hypothetical protein